MCGRYALTSPPAVIAERFHLLWTPKIEPHYNIAPSQTVPVVRETGQGRELAFLRWGLIPSWAKEASIGMKLINARGEGEYSWQSESLILGNESRFAPSPLFILACTMPPHARRTWRESRPYEDAHSS